MPNNPQPCHAPKSIHQADVEAMLQVAREHLYVVGEALKSRAVDAEAQSFVDIATDQAKCGLRMLKLAATSTRYQLERGCLADG